MGHEAPFELKYIGIGNEQWGDNFFKHYEAFVDAFDAAKSSNPELYGDIELMFSAGVDDGDSGADYMYAYDDSQGNVFVPSGTWPVIFGYDEPQNLLLKADSTDTMATVGKAAEEILNSNLNVTDGSDVTYKAQDLQEQAKQIQQLSQSTNMMLIWIAGISLLVGGIGVMNIMLVSVTERTSEIGLKKAIGAGKGAILGQFLTEAVVLTSLGGLVGVLVGVILSKVISMLNGTPTAISPAAAILAVLFSMAIGIIFGLLPSYKAANLNPIDALRHE